MTKEVRLISGTDVESTEIVGLHCEGVEPKPRTQFYLDVSLSPSTHLLDVLNLPPRLLDVKVVLSAENEEGDPAEHVLDFEDPFPTEALPRRGTVGIELHDFLDPRDETERVVTQALSNLLTDDAELWVTRDETDPSKERIIVFRLRIGAAYEDEVECKLDDLAGLLEPVETELDPKLVAAMDRALGPLPEKSECS